MNRVFEIRKAGFANKGAAMMLIEATRQLREHYPGALIAVQPDSSLPFEPRARLGLWHRAEFRRLGVDLASLLDRAPQRWRRRYGFVTEREIDVVIDAAGLAYSDQWGARPTIDLAARAARWKAAGKKLILLPQAFGPFSGDAIRAAIRTVADNADLIFVRDVYSYEHLTEVTGERPTIRMGPDFTTLLEPAAGAQPPPGAGATAVVPNIRMVDKTDEAESRSYQGFLEGSVRRLQDAGVKPFFLVHETEGGDQRIADAINARLDIPVATVVADDPLAAKGIIGACSGLLGSRYHALISALSQEVPAVATGWSHKYRALFEDYECPESLTPVTLDGAELDRALRPLTDAGERSALAARLKAPAARIKRAVRLVWQQVFEVIDA